MVVLYEPCLQLNIVCRDNNIKNMRIVFVSNFINHHQVPLADELYKRLGDNYTFVAREPMPESFRQSGYPDYSDRPYLLNAYESEDALQKMQRLINDADVVIKGHAPDALIEQRLKDGKLTFRNCERFFKEKPWFMTGLRGWLHFLRYYVRFNNKPSYMLASSAYTANDMYHVGAYKNKVFKWGYFTQIDSCRGGIIPNCKESEITQRNESNHGITSIMWCARFLGWKHPELPVQLAAKLKTNGYHFIIDMYGSGEDLQKTQLLAERLNVSDVVKFRGNVPNDEILREMFSHSIFLFTSDQNEGWGAVLNEAMSCGCAAVASNRIGATPYLIKNKRNGLVFESENLDSLYKAVKLLLDDKNYLNKISEEARKTMVELWNPQVASERLINLCENLLHGRLELPSEGPCSMAKPVKYDFYKEDC